MMEAKDWLVLTLDSQHEPIRIQKTLFKLAREANLSGGEVYEFRPYNWGPFSARIYQDVDALVLAGVAERVPQPDASWASYRLTPSGSRKAAALRGKADPGALAALERISRWVADRPFGQLLRDLYADYPEMAEQSLFRQYA